MRPKFIAVVLYLLSLSYSSYASDSFEETELETQSSFGFSTSYNDDDNSDFSLDLNWEFPGHQNIWLIYSESESNQTGSDSESYQVGVSTDLYQTFSIGVEFSYLNVDDLLETRTLKNELSLSFENWGLSYNPQLTAISFKLTRTSEDSYYDLYAMGHELAASYYGWQNNFINVRFFNNHISNPPASIENSAIHNLIVSTFPQIILLDIRTEFLATNLEKNRVALSLGHFFSWGNLIAQWMRSEFLYTDGYVSNIALSLDYQLHKSIGIDFGVGTQIYSIDNDKTNYLITGLRFFW